MSRYCARGVCDRTEVKTHASWRPPVNSYSYLNPKIPFECHHGVVRCVGRCHLHLFPVFTSAIDSCAPIFIKPLFHSFPPVICLSLPTHTTPSSLLSLSSTSPQLSLSTHLLSARLHTGAKNTTLAFLPVSLKCIPSSSDVQSSLQALRFCHLIFVLLWPKCPKWVPLWEFPLGSGCINLVSGRKESGSPLPLLLPPLASDCD